MIVTNNTSRMAKLHFENIFLGRPLPRPGDGSNLSVVVARASWGLRTGLHRLYKANSSIPNGYGSERSLCELSSDDRRVCVGAAWRILTIVC